jgi:hypothetical protein
MVEDTATVEVTAHMAAAITAGISAALTSVADVTPVVRPVSAVARSRRATRFCAVRLVR